MLLHSVLFEYKNPFVLPILYNKPMQCATKKGDYSSETMSLKSNTPLHSSISRSRLHIFSAVLNNNIFRYNEIEYQQFKEDGKRETALHITANTPNSQIKSDFLLFMQILFIIFFDSTTTTTMYVRCLCAYYCCCSHISMLASHGYFSFAVTHSFVC